MQTIIMTKMEGQFDNLKHFYQNVCYALLTQLLRLDSYGSVNVLESLNRPGIPSLLDVVLSLLSSASKQFQNCYFLKLSGKN